MNTMTHFDNSIPTFATLQWHPFCATPSMNTTYSEYNDWVGLLTQNRLTGRYAAQFVIEYERFITSHQHHETMNSSWLNYMR